MKKYNKTMQKMFNFNDVTKENIKEHNLNWLQIPDHLYRILIIDNQFTKLMLIKFTYMIKILMKQNINFS